jgi:hypothetical protein
VGKFSEGLKALQDPKNKPIRWLLGPALEDQAERTTGHHFLLDALARPKRPSSVVAWNARIDQFRGLLVNPDQAPEKAAIDLKSGNRDAEEKLVAFMAEIMAVIHLKRLGYEGFKILLPTGKKKIPDFEALFNGKCARIEVKNLRHPADRVRTVAVKRWKELVARDASKYGIRVLLRHSHWGSLSQAAQSRLRTILDQLPDRKETSFTEVLEGGVRIRFEKIDDPTIQRSLGERVMLQSLNSGAGVGQIVVVGAVSTEDLAIAIDEVQCLLLKLLGPLVEASHKFFGEDSFCPEYMNVVALRWEPPGIWFSPEVLTYTAEKIENLFADFRLQLRPVIFCDPELPWDLINRYR